LAVHRDRSNIGNAKVAGMAKDLNLVGYQYNIAAAVFFLLYSAAEIPRWEIASACLVEYAHWGYVHSNLALKLLRPSIWSVYILL
jgi:hypothetical protein